MVNWTCLHSPHAAASLVYAPTTLCCRVMKEIVHWPPVRDWQLCTIDVDNGLCTMRLIDCMLLSDLDKLVPAKGR